MSLITTRLGIFALLLGCSAGCGLLSPSGPSDVARGEYYSAGQPDFDQFFIQLHRHQVALLRAPEEPREARGALARALGLTTEASDDSLSARVKQEAKKLADQGVRLRLEIPEAEASLDASATLHISNGVAAASLRPALPEQATRVVRSRSRSLAATAELERLGVAGIGLEARIDSAFRTEGPWKRDEVRRNLADGQKLITVMLARSREVAEFDAKLLALLALAATTDANLGRAPATEVVPTPTPDDDKSRAEGKKKSAAQATARKPGAARPRPTASVAKPAAPASTDGEAPAPKPTQGSAPAEIEP